MTIPTPANEPALFEPPVSTEDISAEVQNFIGQLGTLSAEDVVTRGGWTILILASALVLLWTMRIGLRLAARRLSPTTDKDNEQSKEARRHVGGRTMAVARFIVAIIAVGAVLYVWGFDVRSGALGQMLGVVWRAGLIIILAIAAIEVSSFAITRGLHRGARHSRDLRRAAQLRTLAPVLKGVATTMVTLIAAMMALSEFGVEIGPLIAGAGIIGLAVGFGAQTLVKDFLTGIFLILEDTVSIGDIITIGDFGGVVEDMSLRTIKLRDFDGTLHIFPYSEAQVIHNKTKSFGYAVFELNIDQKADVATALDLMLKVGEELREDPVFSGYFLEPIDVVGVDRLSDAAVMLKARIKTAPGRQWALRREYLKRIKLAFDAAGVEMPTSMKLVPLPPPQAAAE